MPTEATIPQRFRALALAIMALVSGVSCAAIDQNTLSEGFQGRYKADFTYAKVSTVKQSSQRSCGVACLTCVLNYWDKPIKEKELRQKHAPLGEIGYPLVQLKKIALEEGMLAFAISMKRDPAGQLSRQLKAGRPVIAALQCPQGRYFGKPVPVIERIDRRTIWNFGSQWKQHYVVVFGEGKDAYLIMDPAYGIVEVGRAEFLDFWSRSKHATLVCAEAG